MTDNDLDRAGKQRFVRAFATTVRTGGAGRKRRYVIAVVAAVVLSAGTAVAIGAMGPGKPGKGSASASLSALSRNSSASPSSASTTPSARPGTPGTRKTAPARGAQPTYVVVQGGGPPPPEASPRRTSPAPSSTGSTDAGVPPASIMQSVEQPAEPSSTPPAPAPSTAAPASTTPTSGSLFITGQVECESGASVEGVWVGTNDGPGWASWMKIGNGSTSDWWYTLPANEPYHLNVGCGGSASAWTLTITTPTVEGGHNSFNCYDGKAEADYDTCVLR